MQNAQPADLKEQQEKQAQMLEIRKEMLTKILSADARERLSRIKLVKPEKAEQLENNLLKLAQSGAFNEPVSEAYLVSLLEKISGASQETKIKFVRKRRDDDDDF